MVKDHTILTITTCKVDKYGIHIPTNEKEYVIDYAKYFSYFNLPDAVKCDEVRAEYDAYWQNYNNRT